MSLYVPILKNRTIEMRVIKELISIGLSYNTIPMIEVIQEKSRSNSNQDYVEEIKNLFINSNKNFFLDIPKINITGSTSEAVRNFMTRINRQKGFWFNELKRFNNVDGAIPVLSYNSKEIPNEQEVVNNIVELHKYFSSIALRLTPTQYNQIGEKSLNILNKNDFFIFDIDNKGHTNPAFKLNYKSIDKIKKCKDFKSIIINSNRPSSMHNKDIIDGQPIQEIDNSLLEMYSLRQYKFDGFGDYACTANSLPSTGGAISPAGIYYSFDNNFFVGYKARIPSLSEFQTYIAPQIVNSQYWNEYDKKHHDSCPGCKKIKSISIGVDSGKNQGTWKGICMSHYIYTIDQLMKK